MSIKAKDAVFSRWLLDPKFRTLLDNTPEVALAGYDLTVQERDTLLNTLSRPKRYTRRVGRESATFGQNFPPTFIHYDN